MSAEVKIKHVKDVKGPRPKRSNSTPSPKSDPIYMEALNLYQKAIASNCKIQDLKAFLGLLLLRGAYLENNHNEWLDKIFVQIRDLVRDKDVGPLHLTLLMQAVEMRAKHWAMDLSIESYYKAKVPVAIQMQKVYEDIKLHASVVQTLRSVFCEAKIRHNRDSLNFECDIHLPTKHLVSIDNKTWHKLERKTDCRVKVNKDSTNLQHVSIQGPLKSNIRHCLEVLENLVLPDSDENDDEPVSTPVKPSLQKTKSWPGHSEFSALSNSIRKTSFREEHEAFNYDPDGLIMRSGGGAMTLQSKLNNSYSSLKAKGSKGSSPEEPKNRLYQFQNGKATGRDTGSTSAHGDTSEENWEDGEEYPTFILGKKQFQVTSTAVNHAHPRILLKTPSKRSLPPSNVSSIDVHLPNETSLRRKIKPSRMSAKVPEQWTLSERMVSNKCNEDNKNSCPPTSWAQTAAAPAPAPVKDIPQSPKSRTVQLTPQKSYDFDAVWGKGDDDTFLSEIESRMGNLHLTKQEEDNSSKEQTSPFGKYGIMATIVKHHSRNDDDADTKNLEKVARRSVLKSWPGESRRVISPSRLNSWPATPRKPSIEDKTAWWRCPAPHYDDSSSTTSVGSVNTNQEHATESQVRYEEDALLDLASSPAAKLNPSSVFDGWPTLVKIFPNICLEEPWGFNPANHGVPNEKDYPW